MENANSRRCCGCKNRDNMVEKGDFHGLFILRVLHDLGGGVWAAFGSVVLSLFAIHEV